MRESEFRSFLEKRYTSNAVNTRVSKGNAVEELLGKSMDTIVSNDETMYQALVDLEKYDDPKRNPRQNALRKYYEFVNGREFPKKKAYELAHNIHR